MDSQEIADQAGHLYDACYETIAVSRNGDQWDVHDGPDGLPMATVDAAVLVELDASYDMPVRNLDGSYWDPPAGAEQ